MLQTDDRGEARVVAGGAIYSPRDNCSGRMRVWCDNCNHMTNAKKAELDLARTIICGSCEARAETNAKLEARIKWIEANPEAWTQYCQGGRTSEIANTGGW